jgi:hypothetical protein
MSQSRHAGSRRKKLCVPTLSKYMVSVLANLERRKKRKKKGYKEQENEARVKEGSLNPTSPFGRKQFSS